MPLNKFGEHLFQQRDRKAKNIEERTNRSELQQIIAINTRNVEVTLRRYVDKKIEEGASTQEQGVVKERIALLAELEQMLRNVSQNSEALVNTLVNELESRTRARIDTIVNSTQDIRRYVIDEVNEVKNHAVKIGADGAKKLEATLQSSKDLTAQQVKALKDETAKNTDTVVQNIHRYVEKQVETVKKYVDETVSTATADVAKDIAGERSTRESQIQQLSTTLKVVDRGSGDGVLPETIQSKIDDLRCVVLFQFVGERSTNFYIINEHKQYIPILMPCKVLYASTNAENLLVHVKDITSSSMLFTELVGKTLRASSTIRIKYHDDAPRITGLLLLQFKPWFKDQPPEIDM